MGDNMSNFYRKSKKEFKKYIKKNPYITRDEWNEYAKKNGFYSAFTLQTHEINDIMIEKLNKQNKDVFQYLKELFIIMPRPRLIFFKRIKRLKELEGKNEQN